MLDRPAHSTPAAADLDHVFADLYELLRRMANRAMRGQSPGHTLQPTALVHEVYLKLAASGAFDAGDRSRVLAVAGRAMRQVLVDHARGRARAKRGGPVMHVTLSDEVAQSGQDVFELVALGEALERLERLDERQVRVVEMRYLAGLTVEEEAAALGVSPTLVKGETALARAWLVRELEPRPWRRRASAGRV